MVFSFTNTNVFNFPIMLSDHAPILVSTASQYHKPRLTFKFENWWTFEEDFQTIAKNAWETTASKSFHTRSTNLAGTLKKWCKKKKPIQQQLDCFQSQINDIQMQPIQQQDHNLEAKLVAQYEVNLTKLTEYYQQREKNIGLFMVTGTLPSFTMLYINVGAETVLYPFMMHTEMTCLI